MKAYPGFYQQSGYNWTNFEVGEQMDLSVIIPCLNEAETLQVVIENALYSIKKSKLKGEVIVADNGSTDGSQGIAISSGARVVEIPIRGYGAALQGGIAEAKGKWIIMGDADDSYALEDLSLFLEKLANGYELVMGNRFAGGSSLAQCPGFTSILEILY
jgi:glycosyltransferase involved in cell wall biosynthesis